MIEMNVLHGACGEAVMLHQLTAYLSDRLFTPRQNKTIEVFVELTRAPLNVPVTCAMLMPRRSGLRNIAPSSFEMTVSTAAGIRDAGQVLAHEMIRISQVVNGRLVLNRAATKKVNGSKATGVLARWMGGKPVIVDQLEWRYRPWEIEACRWQTILVEEFLTLIDGNRPVQQLQKPGKKHLALFDAALSVPQVAKHNLKSHLNIVDVSAAMPPDTGANRSERVDQAGADTAASSSFGMSRLADNTASYDSLLNLQIPPADEAFGNLAIAQRGADDTDDNATSAGALEPVFGAVEAQAAHPPEDMALSVLDPVAPANMDTSQLDGTAADAQGGSGLNGAQTKWSCKNGTLVNGPGTNGYLHDMATLASDNVIQIIVPGLESPRPLYLDSLVVKWQDLQQRGLLNG